VEQVREPNGEDEDEENRRTWEEEGEWDKRRRGM